ncbi:MAG TPA: beta-N-acetylhexosaminidase [Actinocrinis sp.]|nr:beta-N-acetylhexosaminidase [Actinocrinis sp.]
MLACVVAAFGVGIGIGVLSSHGSGGAGSGAVVPVVKAPAEADAYKNIVPAPVEATAATGAPFVLDASTTVAYTPGSSGAKDVADYVATLFRPATGFALHTTVSPGSSGIRLALTAPDTRLGAEGYELQVTDRQVTISAPTSAGLFYGVQTLRQLLPTAIDGTVKQPYTAWPVPEGHVLDAARFGYRGAGLDVTRHFFTVAQVERYIDEISRYKVDYLHLHLSDDQGWRIAIDGWPKLTTVGAATEVGGGAGGFYTQDEYRQLVAYAQSRYVTVIPEIDVPGHVTAVLASYPQLGCTGKPTQVFTGIDVGFSSLCATKPDTATFLHAVFTQLAALTPGPYVAIGGDEAKATSAADYARVVTEAASDVRAAGKIPWGWQEITATPVGTPSVAAYWDTGPVPASVTRAAAAGTHLVLMPANHAYLDQKYSGATALGLDWAGFVDVKDAYDWDPASYLPGVATSSVLGVEGDLWTETITSPADIDYMVFPRLPAIAELGWSAPATHDWAAFQLRLAAQAPRWKAAGIGFYASPEVPWPHGY